MTTQEPVIVIDHFYKAYGKVQAVKGISICVEQGEIFGFLGPNGAGKTTTIRCMLDVIRPTSGTIRVLGLDAQRDKMALHRRIGYLPGDVRLPGQMTGKQVINYFSRLQGREPVIGLSSFGQLRPMTLSCANPQIWETLARRVSEGTSSSTNEVSRALSSVDSSEMRTIQVRDASLHDEHRRRGLAG